ncbi:hypothetical protein [Peribacillus asahii]|uniref:hypothetical protein n=1 Tax=Peribacillus asahii TaxID=228899 RepID=UPI0026CE1B60
MGASRLLKWVSGGLEALLGIPLLGGSIVVGLYWTPLLVMLALHIVSLIISSKENRKKTGHILGIVTSCVAWIPFVGMIMHIISAIFLMIEAGKDE